jgi:hypothetical protein
MRCLVPLPALLLAGCAALGPVECPGGERPAVTETLYFGSARIGGAVTGEEWTAFLRDVVTPRFPEGFTTWRASGQWRGASNAIMSEKSFVLVIVHAPGAEGSDNIAAIASQYKSRFGQEAVLRVGSSGCFSL